MFTGRKPSNSRKWSAAQRTVKKLRSSLNSKPVHFPDGLSSWLRGIHIQLDSTKNVSYVKSILIDWSCFDNFLVSGLVLASYLMIYKNMLYMIDGWLLYACGPVSVLKWVFSHIPHKGSLLDGRLYFLAARLFIVCDGPVTRPNCLRAFPLSPTFQLPSVLNTNEHQLNIL